MKLVASLLVRNELGRYLKQTVTHALTYCDEVRVVDDSSDDGGFEWLQAQDRVEVIRNPDRPWAIKGGHEGRSRQLLFQHTLAGGTTHVVCLDADELVPRGKKLRAAIQQQPEREAWALRIVEMWELDPPRIRTDGGWAPRHAPIAYRAPRELTDGWHAYTLRLACPREPVAVSAMFDTPSCERLDLDLVHLGWSNPAHREARAERYVQLDGGRFHNRDHLDSTLDRSRWRLEPYRRHLPCLP